MSDRFRSPGFVVFVVILAGFAAVSFYLGSSTAEEDMAEASTAPQATSEAKAETDTQPAITKIVGDILEVQETDVILGDENAPVTIIEYSSMSCPHCAMFHTEIFPELKEKYIDAGKVRHVTRFFALNEPALRASMLARCVGDDRFYTFVNVLYDTQDKWAFETDFTGAIKKLAMVGGVNGDTFDACMANKEVEAQVLKERQDAGDNLNIQGTPTLYVNGTKLHKKITFDNIAELIEQKLN